MAREGNHGSAPATGEVQGTAGASIAAGQLIDRQQRFPDSTPPFPLSAHPPSRFHRPPTPPLLSFLLVFHAVPPSAPTEWRQRHPPVRPKSPLAARGAAGHQWVRHTRRGPIAAGGGAHGAAPTRPPRGHAPTGGGSAFGTKPPRQRRQQFIGDDQIRRGGAGGRRPLRHRRRRRHHHRHGGGGSRSRHGPRPAHPAGAGPVPLRPAPRMHAADAHLATGHPCWPRWRRRRLFQAGDARLPAASPASSLCSPPLAMPPAPPPPPRQPQPPSPSAAANDSKREPPPSPVAAVASVVASD